MLFIALKVIESYDIGAEGKAKINDYVISLPLCHTLGAFFLPYPEARLIRESKTAISNDSLF